MKIFYLFIGIIVLSSCSLFQSKEELLLKDTWLLRQKVSSDITSEALNFERFYYKKSDSAMFFHFSKEVSMIKKDDNDWSIKLWKIKDNKYLLIGSEPYTIEYEIRKINSKELTLHYLSNDYTESFTLWFNHPDYKDWSSDEFIDAYSEAKYKATYGSGKVLSIKETSYEAIYQNGEILKGYDKCEICLDNTTFYDTSGNITRVDDYNRYGSLNRSVSYKYDANGKLVEQIYSSHSDSRNNSKWTYTYDDNGNCIEENGYDSDSKHTNTFIKKYDKTGNKIEEISYDENGKLAFRYVNKYDKKGNRIERNTYKREGKLDCRFYFSFDSKGKEMIWYWFNSDGSLQGRWEYSYDENGNKTGEYHYNPDTSLEKKVTYRYEYDDKNQWIKRIEFDNYNIPVCIVERDIKYYK